MNKNIIALCLLSAAAIGLAACSDNDDEPQNINIELLYGSWYNYEEYSYGKWYEVWTFHKGGRFESYWEDYDNNGNLIDEGEFSGSWKYENGIFTLTYEDQTETAIIASLSKDALVFADSEGETTTYYRAYE